MATVLEFWFEFASSYSYPAAMRVETVARAAGVTVAWRPFLLGPVFRELGWAGSPFLAQPVKEAYMWRDVARLCARHGLRFRKPARFPADSLGAARVAVAHAGAPWLPDFVRATYEAVFADDRDIVDPAVLAELLARCGTDPATALALGATDATKALLREQTARAQSLGIFGAPNFLADGELFWGGDRLEDALAWLAPIPAAAHGAATATGVPA